MELSFRSWRFAFALSGKASSRIISQRVRRIQSIHDGRFEHHLLYFAPSYNVDNNLGGSERLIRIGGKEDEGSCHQPNSLKLSLQKWLLCLK